MIYIYVPVVIKEIFVIIKKLYGIRIGHKSAIIKYGAFMLVNVGITQEDI